MNLDLVYDFYIQKFDNKNFIYYKLIYNGTHSKFFNSIENQNYKIDFKNKIWNFE